MKPVIGITPEAITLPSRVDGRGAFCGVSYSQAIELAGGVPVIVPLTRNRGVLDHFLKTCDGWLLTGGGDVSAKFYAPRMPAAQRKKIYGADPVRDEMEIYLLRKLAARDQPVLGICRGIQVMNVAFGGTLVPHLAGHHNPQPDALAHRIDWNGNGRLQKAMDGFDRVNTSHHQAVDRVARGFEVVARAPDGTIEAMEMPGARFCWAVQFHPERLVRKEPRFLRLFEALVNEARKR
jgi:putative glutamine amidotransferase